MTVLVPPLHAEVTVGPTIMRVTVCVMVLCTAAGWGQLNGPTKSSFILVYSGLLACS